MPRNLQLAAVFAMFALAAASAQQPESPAQPLPPRSPTYPTPAPVANPPAEPPARGVLGPAPNFTGNTTTLDPTGYTVGRRVFEAGRATRRGTCTRPGNWCSAEAGRGRLQIQGQPIKEIAVGESAYIPGGTYHWHGAAPNENFTMMFVTMGQSKTSQGEPVTEAVYLGKK